MSPTETDPSSVASRQPDPASGPAVVAIGGGHGLAASLRAIRRFTDGVTAVVSVADDGGSSGRLRDLYHVPAPGDIRRCLLALANTEADVNAALAHRFTEGELNGHVAGNLLLTALTQTGHDFIGAIHQLGTMLDIVGRVLPNADGPVRLTATTDSGQVSGQVAIKEAGGIHSVAVDTPDVACPKPVLDAVAEAEVIVLGPGSLFTSVLAALAVDELREAVEAATAQTVYLCNLRPEPSETPDYDVARHIEALHAHGVSVDHVIYDPAGMEPGNLDRFSADLTPRPAALAGANGLVHDPELLARALSEIH